MGRYTINLSAKSDTVQLDKGTHVMSFMQKMNKSGPNTDTCGTPDVTGRVLEDEPFIEYHCTTYSDGQHIISVQEANMCV